MIEKATIARSFGRCASTYDSAAYFQREVGHQLLSLLPAAALPSVQPQGRASCLVDLGCGTGFFTERLQAYLPAAPLLSIDLAEGMLRYMRQQNRGHQLLCADAEHLPLGVDRVRLLFSNLAVQWCEHVDRLLREMYRVLVPGGLLVFSTLGPNTLFELKQAWAQVDSLVHVNAFQTLHYWECAIAASGLQVVQAQQQMRVLYFDQLRQLAQELKSLGAHNMNSGQRQSLTGRQTWLALQQAYRDSYVTGQGLPASYEVFYWVLQKPLLK
ncbi:MAG: malonyl-ACP O-methyltransferase BioC [Cellvibrionaceae bacterium]|nr:malonyl-ACP O-methyltransferase BioC [Cellvibrionaceae bacterium]